MLRERLEQRARFTREVRDFFASRGFLEVDTPSLCPALIPEASIEVFRTRFFSMSGASRDLFLAPSPELWMKRLIAGGSGDIFQIARSYRNADSGSPIHNPEFRLLEWYSMNASCTDCISTTEDLFARLIKAGVALTDNGELSPPFLRMTMGEAFRLYADIDLAACAQPEDLRREGERLGLGMPVNPTWEEAFHIVFLSIVEPVLPRDRPLVLLDYPAMIPTTAKRRKGTPFAERWELYVKGVEIANCYTEETDPEEIRGFLRSEETRKKECRVSHPTDRGFAELFKRGFPPCAGVALGLDRLEMVMSGETSLEGVILFPLSGILDGQSST
jgi:lysyl-tRNA synthetase class 2